MTRLCPESWLLLTLCAADMLSTVYLLVMGHAVEANPLLGAYLAMGLEWFLVAKAVLFGLLPVGLIEWGRERWPERERRLRLVMRAGVALYVLVYLVGVWGVN